MLTQKEKEKEKDVVSLHLKLLPFTPSVQFSTLHTIVYSVLKVMIGIVLYANHANEKYFKNHDCFFYSFYYCSSNN